jgi:hypothetical protein
MPHLIFSAKNIGYRLDLDPRTAASRIAKLQIEPFAVSVTGEAFYLRDTLDKLEAAELEPQEATQEVAAP